MKILLSILFSVFISINLIAQKEKVKGNKIVKTEQREVEPFHTLEISDDFPVVLDEGSDNIVTIEADGNFHKFIETEVIDGVLKISSRKDLKRYKALEIRIYYNSEINKIVLHHKSEIKSLSPIRSSKLHVEANDDSEIFLTIEAENLKSFLNGKSQVELHTSAKNAFYQVNQNAELKGIVTSDSLKVDLYQKGTAKLEGEIKSALIRVDNDTDFYGEKLTIDDAKLIAEGSSDCYILIKNTIDISATDTTEIFLLGDPKIAISTFSKEATLYKKQLDYTPSKFRLD